MYIPNASYTVWLANKLQGKRYSTRLYGNYYYSGGCDLKTEVGPLLWRCLLVLQVVASLWNVIWKILRIFYFAKLKKNNAPSPILHTRFCFFVVCLQLGLIATVMVLAWIELIAAVTLCVLCFQAITGCYCKCVRIQVNLHSIILLYSASLSGLLSAYTTCDVWM